MPASSRSDLTLAGAGPGDKLLLWWAGLASHPRPPPSLLPTVSPLLGHGKVAEPLGKCHWSYRTKNNSLNLLAQLLEESVSSHVHPQGEIMFSYQIVKHFQWSLGWKGSGETGILMCCWRRANGANHLENTTTTWVRAILEDVSPEDVSSVASVTVNRLPRQTLVEGTLTVMFMAAVRRKAKS